MNNPSIKTKMPSPQERLDLILTGLGRRGPIRELCRQAGVSRELFYRWMGRVRDASLRALEAKVPGPKELKETAEAETEIKKLRSRIEALEQDKRRLSRERNHLDLVAKCAQRIIKRQGWGTLPKEAFKKNAMPRKIRETATAANGLRKKQWEPRPGFSPDAGGFPAPATGDGLISGTKRDGPKS